MCDAILILRRQGCLNPRGGGVHQHLKTVVFALLCAAIRRQAVWLQYLEELFDAIATFPHLTYKIELSVSFGQIRVDLPLREGRLDQCLHLRIGTMDPCSRLTHPAWLRMQAECAYQARCQLLFRPCPVMLHEEKWTKLFWNEECVLTPVEFTQTGSAHIRAVIQPPGVGTPEYVVVLRIEKGRGQRDTRVAYRQRQWS